MVCLNKVSVGVLDTFLNKENEKDMQCVCVRGDVRFSYLTNFIAGGINQNIF